MKVVKRDGNLEDFDQGKIARVMVAAGLTQEQADHLAASVMEWTNTLGVVEVKTVQIREKLLELLPAINPQAADLYSWYEQGKD